MRVDDLLVYGKSKIHKDLSRILLSELLGYNPLELLNHLQDIVDEDICDKYKRQVDDVREGIPIQYVIGNVNFCGIKYYIDNRVLIPRFETEELVENTIKYIKKYFNYPIDIIDLGCGSGNIGITIEKNVDTNKVDLLDISMDALEVTKINVNNLESKARIIYGDMLNRIEDKYDVIISNPPYIRKNEEIEQIVKDNEPGLALYGGEDGLDFYRKILKNVKNNLKDKSLIAFEIGDGQKDDIIKLVKEYLGDLQIICKKDMQERDRMIFIFNGVDEKIC